MNSFQEVWDICVHVHTDMCVDVHKYKHLKQFCYSNFSQSFQRHFNLYSMSWKTYISFHTDSCDG